MCMIDCVILCCLCKPRKDEDGEIEVVLYRKKGFMTRASCSNETCAVCLEDFKNLEEILLCPCGHGYHEECLQSWLAVRNNCPMCQFKLKGTTSDESTPLLRSYTIEL